MEEPVNDARQRHHDRAGVNARRFVRGLGPGMIMAATAIGTSHIVLAPVAGARFGFDLLWLVLFTHLFKYPAFEFGARYAVATETSLIAGYGRLPGPPNWGLIVFLGVTIIQGLTVLAGVMSVTASILVVTVGGLSYTLWLLVLGLFTMAMHRTGRYPALKRGAMAMLALLALGTVVAFVATPPSPGDLARMFVPSVPAGSTLLVASILGLMPTGINVAVWHSLWAVEHLKYWKEDGATSRTMLRTSQRDLAIGYGLSALVGVMLLSLGAVLLRPRGLVPDGIEVALTISRIYTELLGAWMFPVFMIAAFAAMFSTVYSVMDGFPRAFSTLLRTLLPRSEILHRESNPSYWAFMVLIFAFSLVTNTLLPNPVLVVTLVGVISLLIAPVLYGLNYYCVTRLIEDEALRPGTPLRAWAVAGMMFMTFAAGFYAYTRFW
jgi:Mn2+/Fe2+ NRAMP family transporter